MSEKKSAIERYRFVLYICALVLGVVCSPFLLLYMPFIVVIFFGCAIAFLVMTVDSERDKATLNTLRIFFWTALVVQVIIIVLLILALLGSMGEG